MAHHSIELNALEKHIALVVAKRMDASLKRFGENKYRVDKKVSQIESNYEAMMSEMAVCKYLGVYPECTFNDKVMSINAGTDVGDIIYNGTVIDVKHTRYKTGRLAAYKENPVIDVLILVTGSDGKYSIIGGIHAKDFYIKERFKKPPNFIKSCFIAEQNELEDIDKILDTASE
jgi:UDP-N-acetylmuramyl pentapeptide synthase